MERSVLIMGGSGQAGAATAALLRRWYPELPLTIAGRDLGRAQRVADELGRATAVTIDLRRGDLGLRQADSYAAVVATVWDSHLNGLRYAQDRGLPYVSISSGLVDIGPEVVAAGLRAGAAPILLASHWYAGLVVLAVLGLAGEFERIDTIEVGGVLDEQDSGGPAAAEDMARLLAATSSGHIRRDGVFEWVSGPDAQVMITSVDGVVLPGQIVPILDVPSLAVATGAPHVRFAFAVGESAGRRRGGPPSTEVRIDLEGVSRAGASLRTSHYLLHPEGQRPLTALGVALGVERLLGLRGDPVPPGLHTPEALIDPGYAAERMVEIGATFAGVPGDQ
ncbi:hypothetical protein [Nonomuraea soli]|uniref:Saccharopine dehydrogenase n=1 Tax=Nonomuraea soli TaxID=1032476 RepID=A0A7W0HPT4_9ACTN|nr:hypothetical protein [Nonomuraea soli]MBA2891219.1 hypothetical protein [Nonomuraea soli]